MKSYWKIILYGFWVWLIGFAAGFLAWPLHENNFLLFKTLMVVIGTMGGVLMLVIYFKKLPDDYLRRGVIIGVVWFVVNIVLDLIVLVGLFKSPVGEYFIGTGLRYLAMPTMSIGVGWLLEHKFKAVE